MRKMRVGLRKMKQKKGEIRLRKRNCDGRKRRQERIRDGGKEENAGEIRKRGRAPVEARGKFRGRDDR